MGNHTCPDTGKYRASGGRRPAIHGRSHVQRTFPSSLVHGPGICLNLLRLAFCIPFPGAAGMEAAPWAACTTRWARWDREASVSRVTVAPHEKCIHCRASLGLAVCRESTAVLIAGRGVAESPGCACSLEGGGPGGEPAATRQPFLPLRLAGWSRLCSVPADSGAPATTWLRCQARRL